MSSDVAILTVHNTGEVGGASHIGGKSLLVFSVVKYHIALAPDMLRVIILSCVSGDGAAMRATLGQRK